MDQNQSYNHNLHSERGPMSRPQMFVHLEFGLSWSQHHTPRTHTVTYTSRNLIDSRTRSGFPRQLPPPNANFLSTDNHQHRPREARDRAGRQHHQQQQYYYPQLQDQHQRPGLHDRPTEEERSRPQQTHEQRHERRESRSESRGLSHERGKSAPPPFQDSPWDATAGPSASLFPDVPQESAEQPRIWKPLPAPPSSFRLGEDDLPWSAWAGPSDSYERRRSNENEDDSSYANQPTTVPISPYRRRSDDPERSRELESLSAAMVTVDNGFENQWWYQGPRETTAWWPRDQEEPPRLSMADALLLSAAEPPATAPPHGWYAPSVDDQASYLDGVVSPISTISPSRPLQRSMTTRSEELFITSDL
ncbi:hypothetical protein BKA67DRAFT_347565 [Truncatella angustata]|uniref:Uncharacterized protein n=1 Tax=Truncatella angustata TaxID=152316 RepID=A0A9P8ZUY4_9PEZI|nr:uncharacterized protein BKA67DRAFT_347565 [Truncatella angustata]KAH6652094.1 hypothetical protein BKA67DRAFT_347565 [Truncatella angustata]KAH8196047.1 hypothetical protein TruAng_009793 [Truncatella angustata]